MYACMYCMYVDRTVNFLAMTDEASRDEGLLSAKSSPSPSTARMYVCMYVCMYVYLNEWKVLVRLGLYVCMYVCMCMYDYVWIFICMYSLHVWYIYVCIYECE